MRRLVCAIIAVAAFMLMALPALADPGGVIWPYGGYRVTVQAPGK